MAIELQTRKCWPVEETLTVAGTAEQIGIGVGDATTFPAKVKFLEIGYVDLDCYIAPTEAALADAAQGAEGGRIFIKAETGGRVIPWDDSRSVWLENKTGGETPTVYINGLF